MTELERNRGKERRNDSARREFAAGPAVLPVPVLEEARDALLSLGNTGIGILEHSHRGKAFLAVYHETVALFREVGGIPDDYDVLFLQGGASSQFFMVPMNFLPQGPDGRLSRDRRLVGKGGGRGQAIRHGSRRLRPAKTATTATSPKRRTTVASRPTCISRRTTRSSAPVREEPTVPEGALLFCDASSDIFSRPIDVPRYALIYAGAQKNLGPSGVTLVIIRKDLVERGAEKICRRCCNTARTPTTNRCTTRAPRSAFT